MSDIFQRQAKDALINLQDCLKWYAKNRNNKFVGQFLDEEGCKNQQCGIYGMSIWLVLTSEITNDQYITNIRKQCKEKLREIVNQTRIITAPNTIVPDNDNYEMKYIIPKICYAFEALNQLDDAKAEAGILQQYIQEAQHGEGSWGFLTNSNEGNTVITALVLRAFKLEPSCRKNLENGLDYIKKHFDDTKNLYERLFVLNTIHLLDNIETSKNIDTEKNIKNNIKSLYKEVYYNPTKFANPLNIDYNDPGNQRTRYFRLPTDMILLESLILISGSNLQYLHVHAGRRILKYLIDNLKSSKFTKDTSEHRASAGFYFFVKSVLQLICHKKTSKLPRFIKDFHGLFDCSMAFGTDFTYNLLILIVSIIILLFSIISKNNFLTQIIIGILVKSILDLFKSLYNFYKAWGEP